MRGGWRLDVGWKCWAILLAVNVVGAISAASIGEAWTALFRAVVASLSAWFAVEDYLEQAKK